ncbi:MAG: diguanylate cyclase [Hyphomicrobiaceae bacterium]
MQQSLAAERKRNELFQSVFNCLPDALMIANSQRAIQMTNPGVGKMFDYGHDELAGKKTAVLYESQAEFEAQGRARFNLTAEEQLAPYRVKYRRKNGEVFIGETIGTPLRSPAGEVLGFLGAIRDVTDRENANEAISNNERLLRLITDAVPSLIAYVDSNRILRFINATGERWYAEPKDDLIGRNVEDVVGGRAAHVVSPWIDRALAGIKVRERLEVSYRDGKTRTVELAYMPDIGTDGHVYGFVALVVDLTERCEIEKELRAAKNRLEDAINAIPDGFAYYDSEDRLQIFNSQYQAIYAESADIILAGKTFEDILRTGVRCGQYAEAIGREEEWITERLDAHQNPSQPIIQQLNDGRWVRIEERKTRDGGIVGVRVDITEAKLREAELERLSNTDHLTQLPNRRSFLQHLRNTHENNLVEAGTLSLLLIDVDRFKHINDTHGHAMGDEVLKQVASLIALELRGQDRVCRYGGEEFAVMLPDTNIEGARASAERIRTAVDTQTFCYNRTYIRSSVSIGVTLSDHRDRRYEDALARADEALYMAKGAGRNTVIVKPFPSTTEVFDPIGAPFID